jgi:antiviral helicase SKI2
MSLFPDFKQRLSVLKLLGYVDKDAVNITLKGRVACELNTCDELLGAEILFSNLLDPLNPPEAVAMLSALVFQEKNNNEEPLTSRMEVAKATMMDILAKINKLQELEKVSNDEENKISLNFGLATVVYQWARGMSFNDICLVTEFQEGTIVRAITRLDELCKDFMKVSLIIGNPSLHAKMEAASLCIRRDIVFAASLYIVL